MQFAPQSPRGHLGVLGGHKFKSMLKLSNGWIDWHQIWHTCADSSRNGYTPNKLPFKIIGGVKGSNIQRSGEAVKRLDRLAPTLFRGSCLWIHLGMDIG